MQIHPSTKEKPMKNLATRRPAISSTVKMVVGLTLFFFIAKTLGNR